MARRTGTLFVFLWFGIMVAFSAILALFGVDIPTILAIYCGITLATVSFIYRASKSSPRGKY